MILFPMTPYKVMLFDKNYSLFFFHYIIQKDLKKHTVLHNKI